MLVYICVNKHLNIKTCSYCPCTDLAGTAWGGGRRGVVWILGETNGRNKHINITINIIPLALWATGGLEVALFPLPSSIQLSQPFQSLKEWVYPSFNSFPWSLDASPEGGRLSCFRLPTDFFPIHFWTLFRTPFQWPPKPSEDGLESVLDGPW